MLGVGGEGDRRQHVDGQHELDAPPRGLVEEAPHLVELVLLEQRPPDLVALGFEEGVGHAAADEQPVDLGQQVGDDAELVGDLGPAQHHHVGPLGALGQLAQHLDLGHDQPARGVRQQPGHVVDAGVLAVHGAEAVAHVELGQPRQPGRELTARGVVLGLLARLVAQVFQQGHLAVLERLDRAPRALADHIGGEGHVLAEQLAEPRGDGRERVFRVDLALGPAQVGADDDLGAPFEQGLDRRHRRPDAAVVGDRLPVEGDVEVGAHEHAPPLHVEIVERAHAHAPVVKRPS